MQFKLLNANATTSTAFVIATQSRCHIRPFFFYIASRVSPPEHYFASNFARQLSRRAIKIGFLSLPRLCLPFHVLHPWCFGADITTTSRVTRALNNQAVEHICRPRNIHKAREENEKINKNLFVSKALMQSLARLHVFGSHRKAVILAFGGQCRGGRRNRNKHIVNEINMQIGLLSGIGALANWSSSFEGK